MLISFFNYVAFQRQLAKLLPWCASTGKKKLHRLSPVRRYGKVCDAPLVMCRGQVLAHVNFSHVSKGCKSALMLSYCDASYRYYRSHASDVSVLSVAIHLPFFFSITRYWLTRSIKTAVLVHFSNSRDFLNSLQRLGRDYENAPKKSSNKCFYKNKNK